MITAQKEGGKPHFSYCYVLDNTPVTYYNDFEFLFRAQEFKIQRTVQSE